MSENLVCPGCQATFSRPKRTDKPVRCPACSAVHPCSKTGKIDPPVNRGGIKCPGCKKVMARGVNYCVACNISLFDAWGDAEKDAAAAGRRAEINGYADLAAKTVRIFIYFITLRWGKILSEL